MQIELTAKAEQFERLAQKTLDERGICLMTIDARTERYVTNDCFDGLSRGDAMPEAVATATEAQPAEYWSHENPGMGAHRYLSSLAHKKRAGHPASAAREARRIFGGLLEIHRLGNEIEPGFICKPYGGRPSRETSIDELFGHSIALWIYHREFASDQEKRRIAAQCVETARWIVRHDFQYTYFGTRDFLYRWNKPIDHRTPMLKSPMFLHLAGCFAGALDMEHLGAAMTLRGREVLAWREAADGGACAAGGRRIRDEFGCELHNIYQWQAAACVYGEAIPFMRDELDWKRFVVESYEAIRELYLEGRSPLPKARLIALNVGMEAEKLMPGTVSARDAVRELIEIEKTDLGCSGWNAKSRNKGKGVLLDVQALYHWLEAYWRGVCLGWWK